MTRSSRHRVIGTLVLALGILLLLIAFGGGIPGLSGGGGQTVIARFAEANEVDTATPVRIGGVDVGHVSALRPAPRNTTAVVMSITSPGVRLHADAGAQIRWRTLLGGSMYIDLSSGAASAPRLSGEIPVSRTGSQVDWDQFNDQFPTLTREAMRAMLAGLRTGLSAPAAAGQTLRAFGPAAATIGRAAGALRGQQVGELPGLVRSSARTLGALAASASSLRDLVDGADQTLAVTAAHNPALSRAIQLSPPALRATLTSSRELDTMLTQLDALVPALEPGARELAPATAVLAPMLSRANGLLGDARPLLRIAPGALRTLGSASEQGIPLIAGLTPVVTRLNQKLIPLLDSYDPDTRLRLYETFGPTASALSSSLSGFDANGPVINFNVSTSPGSALLSCDIGPGGNQLAQCLVPASKAAALLGRPR